MSELIRVEALCKTYRQGFWMRRVQAVTGVSFAIKAGEIFGFLGPNGAGKTTTIKILTGLIRPTSGSAELFGRSVDDATARRKLGFLPENPYIYPYLTPREFVHLSARLSGLSAAAARSRTQSVLREVGIAYAADRPARALSKGMLQRAGLAAALVADPELLILDEPMSGLDPVGRKEVRDLILRERAAGRTIFFSSHILTDVETLCERVAILRRGEVVVSGTLDALLRSNAQRVEIRLLDRSGAVGNYLTAQKLEFTADGPRLRLEVEGQDVAQRVIAEAVGCGASVQEVAPRNETLEHLFVREAISADPAPAT